MSSYKAAARSLCNFIHTRGFEPTLSASVGVMVLAVGAGAGLAWMHNNGAEAALRAAPLEDQFRIYQSSDSYVSCRNDVTGNMQDAKNIDNFNKFRTALLTPGCTHRLKPFASPNI